MQLSALDLRAGKQVNNDLALAVLYKVSKAESYCGDVWAASDLLPRRPECLVPAFGALCV